MILFIVNNRVAIVFNPSFKYIVFAELPNTKKRINLGLVKDENGWDLMVRSYLDFFTKLILVEYAAKNDFNNRAKEIRNLSNKSIKQRVVIPRFKREKKKPLKGNLLVASEGDVSYIQVSHFRKRRVLKIDTEDLDKLLNVTKKSFYFIARKFNMCDVVYILSKHKYRTNSIYRYILGKRITTNVIHIDGDYCNFRKSNLKVIESKHTKIKKMTDNKVFKGVEGLKGFSYCKAQNCYEIRIMYKGKRIKIGYSKIEEDSAKIYDIALMYYHGIHKTVNYPSDYYFNLEQELVSKWNEALSKRKIQPEIPFGTRIDILNDRQ